MAKQSRKKKTDTPPATNGVNHGSLVRKYKGYSINDAGADGPETNRLTIEKDGVIVNRVEYGTAPDDLNKAIEKAKELIDGGKDQPGKVDSKKTIDKSDGVYEFHKVKLRDDHFIDTVFVREYNDAAYPVRNPGTAELNWPIHDDLKKALQAFAPHWLVLAGYIDAKKIKGEIEDYETPLLDQVKITGVGLSGTNHDGLSISGHRMLYGRAINVNVFPKFYSDADDAYPFGTSAELSWNDLTNEITAYLNGEKRGTPVQPELPFGEDATGGPMVETGL